MTITTMTSREFNQDAGGAKKAAEKGPVIITDRGRPAHGEIGPVDADDSVMPIIELACMVTVRVCSFVVQNETNGACSRAAEELMTSAITASTPSAERTR